MTDLQRPVPLLVAGYGRSGTTALMALLGTDPRVAMGRAYPFEARPLSYSAKMALLLGRNAAESQVPGERFFAFEDGGLGTLPWLPPGSNQTAPGDIACPTALEWFQQFWSVFERNSQGPAVGAISGDQSRVTPHPSPKWHAEKVAAWVPAFVRQILPTKTLYLFRDPRDMYLSANALMRERKYFSFARGPSDSDFDHARNLAYEYLLYFENFRADKERVDCLLIPYEDLVQGLPQLVERLQRFAGLSCQEKEMRQDLGFHRTAASPEKSIDRWRREPLPPGVARFLETYLHESFAAFHYEFSEKLRACPGVEFGRRVSAGAVSGEWSQAMTGPSAVAIQNRPGALDENGIRVQFQDGVFRIALSVNPLESRLFKEIWISLYGTEIEQVSLYWRTEKRDYSARRQMSLPWHAASYWRVLRFPVAQNERWHGEITGLRIEITAGPKLGPEPDVFLRWLRLVE